MTLPFRRRHNDAEAGHDRARSLWSTAMLEPLERPDADWLEGHLLTCGECRAERASQETDRVLLRSLRELPPEPPRDLWARTSAAIEQEAGRRGGRTGVAGDRILPRRQRLPLGALSGVLVALVVVALAFGPRFIGVPGGTVAGSQIAFGTPAAEQSPFAVQAAPFAYVQTTGDGSYQLVLADIDAVCPSEKGCAPLRNTSQAALTLGDRPEALVGSPENTQLIVVSGATGSKPGTIIVVPVPTAPGSGPSVNPTTSAAPSTAATPPAGSESPSSPPSSAIPSESVGPTPLPTPVGAHSIAEGVVVVGETRYSPDGRWLAFSAAPIDGSQGPDLYVWNGTDPTAKPVTSDHMTYFSSWLNDEQILASRVPLEARVDASPGASAASSPEQPVVESHPTSFVYDPATGTETPLAIGDVWLPTVDRTGRFVTYWSGTLHVGPGVKDGLELGTGRLVLDGWLEPLDRNHGNGNGPSSGNGPSNGTGPGNAPSSGNGASSAPASAGNVGPAGTPVELVPGPITAFDARFDPKGTRLAVWVADPTDPSVGTLQLFVLDPADGRINADLDPLPSVKALKGISMDEGRLAWVSPPGQDGNQSTVQVLAWSGDAFGQIETVPGAQLTIVR